jgi:hypothetical protein
MSQVISRKLCHNSSVTDHGKFERVSNTSSNKIANKIPPVLISVYNGGDYEG